MSSWSIPPESRRVGAVPGEGIEVIAVRWEQELGVALASHPAGLQLGTAEDVRRWRDELFRKFSVIEAQRGGRFPLVVCVDGVNIRPAVAEAYGKVVSAYAKRFASGLARYALEPNGVGQIITVAAMKEGYRANLFSSRAEAISHALAEAAGRRQRA